MTCRPSKTPALMVLAALMIGTCPGAARAQSVGMPLTDSGREQVRSTADQTPPAANLTSRPSLLSPFTDVLGDLRHFPSKGTLEWLTVGIAAAAMVHPADNRVTSSVAHLNGQLGESFEAGAVLGGTPLELGAAFAAYAIGRGTGHPRVMQVGAELVRAQLLAELLTTGIKQSARRPRPEGSGYSFSSGHTAVTFASATVLQRHFGWKVGLPAYAVAGYVAASRVEMKRHYLSDVVFGAALGMAAGRTVTVGRRVIVEPLIVSGGAGASFRVIGKP